MLKIWVDDVRQCPESYDLWYHSVNEAIAGIGQLPQDCEIFLDLDHDAGDYCADGGDYIRLLDHIEEMEWNRDGRFSFRIHSSNPAGRGQMMLIIETRGWRYVY